MCWVQWIRTGASRAWRDQTEHGLRDCGRFNHEEYRTWRKQVDFGEYDCCWECALPQSRRAFVRDGRPVEGVNWGNQVLPLVWWIRCDAVWREKLRARFGVEVGGRLAEGEDVLAMGRADPAEVRRKYDECDCRVGHGRGRAADRVGSVLRSGRGASSERGLD